MSFYKIARAAVKGFYRIFFRVRIEGLENIPNARAFVVCPNHTSLLDPPMLGACLPVKLRFMAKEELFKNKLFGALIRALGAFPVKRGSGDIGALKAAMRIVSEGHSLVVFPEGGRSPEGHLRRGKSGAALIALKAKADILPIGICGKYRLFSKITVRIGKPIELDEYFGEKLNSEGLQEITDKRLMPAISELSGVCTYENRDCG